MCTSESILCSQVVVIKTGDWAVGFQWDPGRISISCLRIIDWCYTHG